MHISGIRYSGYVSADGRQVYICLNECEYAHRLIKDIICPTAESELKGYVKFYIRNTALGVKFEIDHVASTYADTERGSTCIKYFDIRPNARKYLMGCIQSSLNKLTDLCKAGPTIDTSMAIIWDGEEIRHVEKHDLNDYYSRYEFKYTELGIK